jgi:hypothetical protein
MQLDHNGHFLQYIRCSMVVYEIRTEQAKDKKKPEELTPTYPSCYDYDTIIKWSAYCVLVNTVASFFIIVTLCTKIIKINSKIYAVVRPLSLKFKVDACKNFHACAHVCLVQEIFNAG